MPRRSLLPLAALFVTLLLLAALLEGMARALVPADPISPPPSASIDAASPNPYVIWARPWCYVNLPGAHYTQRIQAQDGRRLVPYAINAHGFRGPAIPPKGRRPRLLVVGDSFCEGHGSLWENAFVQRIGRSLADEGWETVNAGVQGASPLYYAANLPRYEALAPDAVLLVLYDNDLWEDRVYASLHHSWPRLLRPGRFVGDGSPDLLERLRSYTVLRRWWRNAFPTPLERRIEAQAQSDTPMPDAATPGPALYLAQPGEFDMRWERSQAYLHYFASQWSQRGAPVFVVQLSWQFQNPAMPEAFRRQAAQLEEKYAQWTSGRGLPFLSLIGPVREAMTSQGYSALAIEGDHHPTARGHALIASLLSPWLLERLPAARP